ncbi:MAG: TrkA family potassium uptake protein [Chloroflexi bacterium]|jgi:trk system potassium uptake protein TrkA|nr:TrkA family potassium uptake protein [Chloroflexota bacterium]MDB5076380.1 TrkA family potassium uptake protein [Chloroflexota bacterium]
MRVVILGCGRVGARLAGMLDDGGHQVSVIDENLEAFERLPTRFAGLVVLGNGIDFDILTQAGIEKADALCALSNFDNTNIMASQIAREVFHVPRVITRIYDPERQDTFRQLGLETVCPTRVGVAQIEALLDAG